MSPKDVDPDACRPRDFDRLDGSLLRTQPAGEQRAVARCWRPADQPVGTNGGKIASTETMSRQALAWDADTPATVGAGSAPSGMSQRVGNRRLGGRWSVCTTGALQCGREG